MVKLLDHLVRPRAATWPPDLDSTRNWAEIPDRLPVSPEPLQVLALGDDGDAVLGDGESAGAVGPARGAITSSWTLDLLDARRDDVPWVAGRESLVDSLIPPSSALRNHWCRRRNPKSRPLRDIRI